MSQFRADSAGQPIGRGGRSDLQRGGGARASPQQPPTAPTNLLFGGSSQRPSVDVTAASYARSSQRVASSVPPPPSQLHHDHRPSQSSLLYPFPAATSTSAHRNDNNNTHPTHNHQQRQQEHFQQHDRQHQHSHQPRGASVGRGGGTAGAPLLFQMAAAAPPHEHTRSHYGSGLISNSARGTAEEGGGGRRAASSSVAPAGHPRSLLPPGGPLLLRASASQPQQYHHNYETRGTSPAALPFSHSNQQQLLHQPQHSQSQHHHHQPQSLLSAANRAAAGSSAFPPPAPLSTAAAAASRRGLSAHPVDHDDNRRGATQSVAAHSLLSAEGSRSRSVAAAHRHHHSHSSQHQQRHSPLPSGAAHLSTPSPPLSQVHHVGFRFPSDVDSCRCGRAESVHLHASLGQGGPSVARGVSGGGGGGAQGNTSSSATERRARSSASAPHQTRHAAKPTLRPSEGVPHSHASSASSPSSSDSLPSSFVIVHFTDRQLRSAAARMNGGATTSPKLKDERQGGHSHRSHSYGRSNHTNAPGRVIDGRGRSKSGPPYHPSQWPPRHLHHQHRSASPTTASSSSPEEPLLEPPHSYFCPICSLDRLRVPDGFAADVSAFAARRLAEAAEGAGMGRKAEEGGAKMAGVRASRGKKGAAAVGDEGDRVGEEEAVAEGDTMLAFCHKRLRRRVVGEAKTVAAIVNGLIRCQQHHLLLRNSRDRSLRRELSASSRSSSSSSSAQRSSRSHSEEDSSPHSSSGSSDSDDSSFSSADEDDNAYRSDRPQGLARSSASRIIVGEEDPNIYHQRRRRERREARAKRRRQREEAAAHEAAVEALGPFLMRAAKELALWLRCLWLLTACGRPQDASRATANARNNKKARCGDDLSECKRNGHFVSGELPAQPPSSDNSLLSAEAAAMRAIQSFLVGSLDSSHHFGGKPCKIGAAAASPSAFLFCALTDAAIGVMALAFCFAVPSEAVRQCLRDGILNEGLLAKAGEEQSDANTDTRQEQQQQQQQLSSFLSPFASCVLAHWVDSFESALFANARMNKVALATLAACSNGDASPLSAPSSPLLPFAKVFFEDVCVPHCLSAFAALRGLPQRSPPPSPLPMAAGAPNRLSVITLLRALLQRDVALAVSCCAVSAAAEGATAEASAVAQRQRAQRRLRRRLRRGGMGRGHAGEVSQQGASSFLPTPAEVLTAAAALFGEGDASTTAATKGHPTAPPPSSSQSSASAASLLRALWEKVGEFRGEGYSFLFGSPSHEGPSQSREGTRPQMPADSVIVGGTFSSSILSPFARARAVAEVEQQHRLDNADGLGSAESSALLCATTAGGSADSAADLLCAAGLFSPEICLATGRALLMLGADESPFNQPSPSSTSLSSLSLLRRLPHFLSVLSPNALSSLMSASQRHCAAFGSVWASFCAADVISRRRSAAHPTGATEANAQGGSADRVPPAPSPFPSSSLAFYADCASFAYFMGDSARRALLGAEGLLGGGGESTHGGASEAPHTARPQKPMADFLSSLSSAFSPSMLEEGPTFGLLSALLVGSTFGEAGSRGMLSNGLGQTDHAAMVCDLLAFAALAASSPPLPSDTAEGGEASGVLGAAAVPAPDSTSPQTYSTSPRVISFASRVAAPFCLSSIRRYCEAARTPFSEREGYAGSKVNRSHHNSAQSPYHSVAGKTSSFVSGAPPPFLKLFRLFGALCRATLAAEWSAIRCAKNSLESSRASSGTRDHLAGDVAARARRLALLLRQYCSGAEELASVLVEALREWDACDWLVPPEAFEVISANHSSVAYPSISNGGRGYAIGGGEHVENDDTFSGGRRQQRRRAKARVEAMLQTFSAAHRTLVGFEIAAALAGEGCQPLPLSLLGSSSEEAFPSNRHCGDDAEGFDDDTAPPSTSVCQLPAPPSPPPPSHFILFLRPSPFFHLVTATLRSAAPLFEYFSDAGLVGRCLAHMAGVGAVVSAAAEPTPFREGRGGYVPHGLAPLSSEGCGGTSFAPLPADTVHATAFAAVLAALEEPLLGGGGLSSSAYRHVAFLNNDEESYADETDDDDDAFVSRGGFDRREGGGRQRSTLSTSLAKFIDHGCFGAPSTDFDHGRGSANAFPPPPPTADTSLLTAFLSSFLSMAKGGGGAHEAAAASAFYFLPQQQHFNRSVAEANDYCLFSPFSCPPSTREWSPFSFLSSLSLSSSPLLPPDRCPRDGHAVGPHQTYVPSNSSHPKMAAPSAFEEVSEASKDLFGQCGAAAARQGFALAVARCEAGLSARFGGGPNDYPCDGNNPINGSGSTDVYPFAVSLEVLVGVLGQCLLSGGLLGLPKGPSMGIGGLVGGGVSGGRLSDCVLLAISALSQAVPFVFRDYDADVNADPHGTYTRDEGLPYEAYDSGESDSDGCASTGGSSDGTDTPRPRRTPWGRGPAAEEAALLASLAKVFLTGDGGPPASNEMFSPFSQPPAASASALLWHAATGDSSAVGGVGIFAPARLRSTAAAGAAVCGMAVPSRTVTGLAALVAVLAAHNPSAGQDLRLRCVQRLLGTHERSVSAADGAATVLGRCWVALAAAADANGTNVSSSSASAAKRLQLRQTAEASSHSHYARRPPLSTATSFESVGFPFGRTAYSAYLQAHTSLALAAVQRSMMYATRGGGASNMWGNRHSSSASSSTTVSLRPAAHPLPSAPSLAAAVGELLHQHLADGHSFEWETLFVVLFRSTASMGVGLGVGGDVAGASVRTLLTALWSDADGGLDQTAAAVDSDAFEDGSRDLPSPSAAAMAGGYGYTAVLRHPLTPLLLACLFGGAKDFGDVLRAACALLRECFAHMNSPPIGGGDGYSDDHSNSSQRSNNAGVAAVARDSDRPSRWATRGQRDNAATTKRVGAGTKRRRGGGNTQRSTSSTSASSSASSSAAADRAGTLSSSQWRGRATKSTNVNNRRGARRGRGMSSSSSSTSSSYSETDGDDNAYATGAFTDGSDPFLAPTPPTSSADCALLLSLLCILLEKSVVVATAAATNNDADADDVPAIDVDVTESPETSDRPRSSHNPSLDRPSFTLSPTREEASVLFEGCFIASSSFAEKAQPLMGSLPILTSSSAAVNESQSSSYDAASFLLSPLALRLFGLLRYFSNAHNGCGDGEAGAHTHCDSFVFPFPSQPLSTPHLGGAEERDRGGEGERRRDAAFAPSPSQWRGFGVYSADCCGSALARDGGGEGALSDANATTLMRGTCGNTSAEADPPVLRCTSLAAVATRAGDGVGQWAVNPSNPNRFPSQSSSCGADSSPPPPRRVAFLSLGVLCGKPSEAVLKPDSEVSAPPVDKKGRGRSRGGKGAAKRAPPPTSHQQQPPSGREGALSAAAAGVTPIGRARHFGVIVASDALPSQHKSDGCANIASLFLSPADAARLWPIFILISCLSDRLEGKRGAVPTDGDFGAECPEWLVAFVGRWLGSGEHAVGRNEGHTSEEDRAATPSPFPTSSLLTIGALFNDLCRLATSVRTAAVVLAATDNGTVAAAEGSRPFVSVHHMSSRAVSVGAVASFSFVGADVGDCVECAAAVSAAGLQSSTDAVDGGGDGGCTHSAARAILCTTDSTKTAFPFLVAGVLLSFARFPSEGRKVRRGDQSEVNPTSLAEVLVTGSPTLSASPFSSPLLPIVPFVPTFGRSNSGGRDAPTDFITVLECFFAAMAAAVAAQSPSAPSAPHTSTDGGVVPPTARKKISAHQKRPRNFSEVGAALPSAATTADTSNSHPLSSPPPPPLSLLSSDFLRSHSAAVASLAVRTAEALLDAAASLFTVHPVGSLGGGDASLMRAPNASVPAHSNPVSAKRWACDSRQQQAVASRDQGCAHHSLLSPAALASALPSDRSALELLRRLALPLLPPEVPPEGDAAMLIGSENEAARRLLQPYGSEVSKQQHGGAMMQLPTATHQSSSSYSRYQRLHLTGPRSAPFVAALVRLLPSLRSVHEGALGAASRAHGTGTGVAASAPAASPPHSTAVNGCLYNQRLLVALLITAVGELSGGGGEDPQPPCHGHHGRKRIGGAGKRRTTAAKADTSVLSPHALSLLLTLLQATAEEAKKEDAGISDCLLQGVYLDSNVYPFAENSDGADYQADVDNTTNVNAERPPLPLAIGSLLAPLPSCAVLPSLLWLLDELLSFRKQHQLSENAVVDVKTQRGEHSLRGDANDHDYSFDTAEWSLFILLRSLTSVLRRASMRDPDGDFPRHTLATDDADFSGADGMSSQQNALTPVALAIGFISDAMLSTSAPEGEASPPSEGAVANRNVSPPQVAIAVCLGHLSLSPTSTSDFFGSPIASFPFKSFNNSLANGRIVPSTLLLCSFAKMRRLADAFLSAAGTAATATATPNGHMCTTSLGYPWLLSVIDDALARAAVSHAHPAGEAGLPLPSPSISFAEAIEYRNAVAVSVALGGAVAVGPLTPLLSSPFLTNSAGEARCTYPSVDAAPPTFVQSSDSYSHPSDVVDDSIGDDSSIVSAFASAFDELFLGRWEATARSRGAVGHHSQYEMTTTVTAF